VATIPRLCSGGGIRGELSVVLGPRAREAWGCWGTVCVEASRC
jgi:hypothetical protein